jgi:hypothetical protein
MLRTIVTPLLALVVVLAGCDHESFVAPFGEAGIDDPEGSRVESIEEVEESESYSGNVTRELLARIELDEGHVDFCLVDGKMILVSSQSPDGPDRLGPLASLGPDVHSRGAIGIFEALADVPAPSRLVKAQGLLETRSPLDEPQPVLRLQPEIPAPCEIGNQRTPVSDEVAADKMSASAFTSTYCYSGGDFNRCRTDQTVGKTFTYDCWYMSFVVNCTSGRVGQKLRYQKSSGWVTAGYQSLPAGTIGEMQIMHSWGALFISRDTRAIVNNVDGGDNYHVAIWGLY